MTQKISFALARLGLSLIWLAAAGCSGGTIANPDGSQGASELGGGTSDGGGQGAQDQGSSGGNPESDPLLVGITAAHNSARASVMPPPSTPMPALQWSTTVAAAAQAWANNCMFAHGGSGGYGQNIFADTGQNNAQGVVASWIAESKNYNYATNSCTSTCGHYTQVVWAQSLRLGCAVGRCSKNSPFGSANGGVWNFWVCDYDPPGNFLGQRPY